MVSWIATSNDIAGIHPAILSRLTVIEVNCPTPAQMPAVVASINRELVSNAEWGQWFEPLSAEVLAALTALSPREVWRAIEDAHANAACAGRRVVMPGDVSDNRSSRHKRHRIGFIHSNERSET